MVGTTQVLQDATRSQAADNSSSPDLPRLKSVLVVGLGNPILGDDGFGWIVAGQVSQILQDQSRQGVTVECLSLGGLSLMEHLIGYDRVILIDAFGSDSTPPGRIQFASLGDLEDPSMGHTSSPHDTTLQNAIRVGRSLGARLPDEVIVVSVSTNPNYEFSEQLSPAVAATVPRAAQLVIDLLSKNGS
jgi:hydrogenase maturation protease